MKIFIFCAAWVTVDEWLKQQKLNEPALEVASDCLFHWNCTSDVVSSMYPHWLFSKVHVLDGCTHLVVVREISSTAMSPKYERPLVASITALKQRNIKMSESAIIPKEQFSSFWEFWKNDWKKSVTEFPADIYLFKVNNRNARTYFNFEHILHFFSASIANYEQVNVSWV